MTAPSVADGIDLTDPMPPPDEHGLSAEDGTGTVTWWIMLAIGGAIIAFGVLGLIDALAPQRLARWVGWFAGGLLVHDLVAVPLYSALGLGLRRVVPRAWRAPVQVGAILSAVLALIAWPLVRGYGRAAQAGNDSILPHDYGLNLAVVLGVIWVVVALAGIVRSRRDA